jgi:ATP-dependent Clp protease protease subunit
MDFVKHLVGEPPEKPTDASSSSGTQNSTSMDENGILYLSGPINFENAGNISRQIMEINYEGKLSCIRLMISSPGGECDAGFSLIDVMKWSRIPVWTTGLGLAASMGFLILMAGERGHRSCSKNTTLLSHRFSVLTGGNYSDLLAHRIREDRLHKAIVNHYIENTKLKTQKEVEKLLLKDVDNYVSVDEALRYGIIDSVIRPHSGPR